MTLPPKDRKLAGLYNMLALVLGLVCVFQNWVGGHAESHYRTLCESGAQAYLSGTDSLSCCYGLSYEYDPTAGLATAIETRLLSPESAFSAIQYPLSSGWSYQSFEQGRRLRWQHVGGLPAGNQPLFDFCLEAPQTGLPVEMAVNWLVGGETRCSDTLRLACYQCLAPQNESLVCLEDGGYAYTFGLVNLTGFFIHRLRLSEPAGQDFIVEEFLNLPGSWLPGDSIGGFHLTLRPEAEELETLCFEITASRLLGDSSALDCCTFTLCLELPLCDRCCTPFEEFQADVSLGFTVSSNCETGFFSATYQGWGPCDRTFWNLRNLNTGMGIGGTVNTNSISFTFLDETPYQLCMRVERRYAGGINCYGSTTLTVCDTLFFDCPDPPCVDSSFIDWAFECPPDIELVCGCDSMTYLNSCAAMNWSAVLGLSEGPCGEPPVDSLSLGIVAFNPEQSLLEWTSLGGIDYRFFLVQRRLSGGNWVTIGLVDGSTFTFLDNDPAGGLSEYRIIGATWPGKPVFSNVVELFLSGSRDVAAENVRLWPNPARQTAYLQLPWAGPTEVAAFDARGRRIVQWWLPGTSNKLITLPIEGWQAGLYFLQAKGPDEKAWAGKLLKGP